MIKYRTGDKVTIVLGNVDAERLNTGTLLLVHPDQVIAHEPTKEVSEVEKFFNNINSAPQTGCPNSLRQLANAIKADILKEIGK